MTLKELKTYIGNLATMALGTRADVVELRSQVNQLAEGGETMSQAQIDSINQAIASAATKADAAVTAVNALAADLQAAREAIARIEGRMTDWDTQDTALRNTVTALVSTAASTKTLAEANRDSLAELGSRIAAIEAKVDDGGVALPSLDPVTP